MSTTTLITSPDPDDTGEARIFHLPTPAAAPDDTPGTSVEPAGPVVDGELLSPAEEAELDARRLVGEVAVRHATRVVRVVRTTATHPHTVTTVRVAARAVVTVWRGAESWASRAWDGATLGVYRRQIKAAEARGDTAALAEWIDRRDKAAEARHNRLRELPSVVLGVAKVAVGSLFGLVAVVLLVALVAQLSGAAGFGQVIDGALAGVRWVFDAVMWAWTPLLWSLPVLGLLAAWREGRRHGRPVGWLATSAEADADVAIDETTIAAALGALRIPQVSAYLKQGLPLQFLTPCRVDGRGTHAVIRLPAGVPAEQVARRRDALATGLHRLAKEVWPTTGAEAGILDLWIADKGALAEGAGAYPLLTDGLADVFKGVPFGKTLRGEPIAAPLMERNTITGGMPGQGKSSAARVIMAGAALDPTAELRIWVPDANFDFEVFAPRCSRYVMGAEDEKIAEILEDLRELHAEVQRRGQLLVEHETPAVTRELASKVAGLHPLFGLLEEAHVAIQHKEHGPEIARLLVDIVRLGRKRGIHLIVSTQAPTKDSMPRDVTRNCSNGIAFAVGDHVANDALLGQGAYAAGHRATELIPGTDRGTAVVKGFTGERSDIVQVYFLDVAKENDQVTPLIRRAMAAIDKRGRGLPGARAARRELPASRDLLEDLDEVLGSESLPVADVPALLRDLAPDWPGYRALTGKALRELLAAEHGIKVPSTGNRWPLDPVTIRDALAKRATADLDDES